MNKNLFEKLVRLVEDYMDSKAVEETDFSDGRDFDEVVEELGLEEELLVD